MDLCNGLNMRLQTGRSLSEFSTFGIGGPIALFAEIAKVEEMEEAFAFSQREKIPFFILGKGSNCLFSDEGFKGLVLLNKIALCEWRESEVRVGAGYSFSLLGIQAARRSLSGLEFASGIPASVGGAIFMNAGANGRETADVLSSVSYLRSDGRKEIFSRAELEFRYRNSPFQGRDGAILEATFALALSEKARAEQLRIVEYRMKTQPLKEKSAGCVFRNPEKAPSAGALIEQCGLKGYQVGGAQVSRLHANFFLNTGGATARDVRELIQLVQERVYERTGIRLDPEIRIVPHGL